MQDYKISFAQINEESERSDKNELDEERTGNTRLSPHSPMRNILPDLNKPENKAFKDPTFIFRRESIAHFD